MVFRTFNRKLYFKTETSEGTFNAPNLSTGFIECTDPTYSITNRMFERNPTRLSITPAPQIVAGISSTSPSATVEISFSVELAGSGTAATAPRWGDLLQACGMAEITTIKSTVIGNLARAAGGPACLRNYENISFVAGTSYVGGDRSGRVISDTFYDDTTLYYIEDGEGATWASSDNVAGQASATYGTAASPATSGVGYVLTSGDELGGGDSSSVSFKLFLDDSNAYIGVAGARGNVEFAFVAGDRVMMNFTFSGRLAHYGEAGTPTPTAEGRPIPPAFQGVNMTIQDSTFGTTPAAAIGDQIFNSMTINLGNEVTVRENVEVASGYDAGYITGRTPTMTWNPDAVLAATATGTNYWQRFLSGETSRVKLHVGTTAGNQFLFKMPAAQFTGIADGNRDEVVVYDSTTTLTGGDYGSSVQEITGTDSTVTNARLGTNNEFAFFQL